MKVPFALLSGCLVLESGEWLETGITEIDEQGLVFRMAEQPGPVLCMQLSFYHDRTGSYETVELSSPEMEEVSESQSPFYRAYQIHAKHSVQYEAYREAVRNLEQSYYHYIMKKLDGDDAALAEDYTGYPAALDDMVTTDFSQQKKMWYKESFPLEQKEDGGQEAGKVWDQLCDQKCENTYEIAAALDRPVLYERYLARPVSAFYRWYWEETGILEHPLARFGLNRLYIGNQFCPHLIPDQELLSALLEKAQSEQLAVTVVFSYMREEQIAHTGKLFAQLAHWCRKMHSQLEIVANDWGMLSLLKPYRDCLLPVMGVLLNKRRKDPRMQYKIGLGDGKALRENPLNSDFYREYLKKTYGIVRFEQEACGYGIALPPGKNSIHLPYYQTNTSQYCPLYARCHEGSRGRQKEIKDCPQYCREYVFSYPDHLRMVGCYNSLFAYDREILSEESRLPYDLSHGADRIVLNFL